MAGSGVTSTKRARDHLCGSCPGAILSASKKGFPFDLAICVEIDKNKAITIEKRLKSLKSSTEIMVYNNDILDVSSKIAQELQNKTVSYIVIDPQALQGLTWSSIEPLLKCKGDTMVTWFEAEAWRLKCAAMSETEHLSSQSDKKRLTELIGNENWLNTKISAELTELFINRVLSECGKSFYAKVKIPRQAGDYWMILFTGKFNGAEKLKNEWKERIENRINSAHGKDIASLLDIKAKRITKLDDFS